MQNKTKGLILPALLILASYTALGFFRDYVFMNINSQLYKLYFKNYEFNLPNLLSMFNDWPYMQLYYFKYILTALFVLIYFSASILIVWLVFREKQKFKWVVMAHLSILTLATIVYLFGYFGGIFREGFVLTRNLMGLVQSPFITMLLIPAFYLENSTKNKS